MVATMWPLSGDDFDYAHHAFILMVDGMAVIHETADDYRVGEGDHDLQQTGSGIGCWRYREGVVQAVLVLGHAIDLGHQERRLMDMEAVILLVGIDDSPLLGVARLHGLVDAIFIHHAPVYHEGVPVGRF